MSGLMGHSMRRYSGSPEGKRSSPFSIAFLTFSFSSFSSFSHFRDARTSCLLVNYMRSRQCSNQHLRHRLHRHRKMVRGCPHAAAAINLQVEDLV